MPTDEPHLSPATQDELEHAIAHALRFNGRKRFKGADGYMAEIAARHLVEKLRLSGFVVMKKPPIVGAAGNYRGPDHRTD